MPTECPECGGDNTSTLPHAGPTGKAIVKCFGDCDGARHEVEDYEEPEGVARSEPEPEPKQTSLSDW